MRTKLLYELPEHHIDIDNQNYIKILVNIRVKQRVTASIINKFANSGFGHLEQKPQAFVSISSGQVA